MTRRAVLCIALLLIAACNAAESDWRDAQKRDTAAGYESFTREHPESPHAAEARSRAESIHTAGVIDSAIRSKMIEGLAAVIAQYPRHPDTSRARELLERLRFDDAVRHGTVAEMEAFVADFPQSHHSGALRPRIAAIYDGRPARLRGVRTLRVELSERYGEAHPVLFFKLEVERVARYFGLRLVEGEADAVLSIAVAGTPLHQRYSYLGVAHNARRSYEGVELRGTMTLRAAGISTVERFSRTILPPKYLAAHAVKENPDHAPFDRAFDESCPFAIRHLFGRVFGIEPLFAELTGLSVGSRAAGRVLGRWSPPPLERLIALLAQPGTHREMVALALGDARTADAAQPLLDAVRLGAVRPDTGVKALAAIGKAAVPVLLRSSSDGDEKVAVCAIDALGAIHDPASTDALLALSYSAEPKIRAAAVRALGEIGTNRVIAELMPRLKKNTADAELRSALARARELVDNPR